ncbi:MAG: 3-keto-5-aminohexanoate cleavage protein [Syntrophales bacterium]|nr:3-keto-5-aminohexanoate cleavage protein [Syntrophales bacterium]
MITCCVTGGANVPSMSPYLPLTPQAIADSAVAAAEAGAAILHLHARDPGDGRPSHAIDHYRPALEEIKGRSPAVISLTMPGPPGVPLDERTAHLKAFSPEMAAFVPGSSNYAFHNRLNFVPEPRFEWERKFLEDSRSFVYANTFTDCEQLCQLFKGLRIRPEMELFGLSHLYNLAYLVEQQHIDLPLHLEFVMGLLGGVRAEAEDLIFMVNKAERLFGKNRFTWSLSGMIGFGRFDLFPLAVQMGGHVRIGLEDNVQIREGVLATSNAELVQKIVRLAEESGRPVAGPEQVRGILGLKGADQVGF